MIDLIEEMSPSARADFVAGLKRQDPAVIVQLHRHLDGVASGQRDLADRARGFFEEVERLTRMKIQEAGRELAMDLGLDELVDLTRGTGGAMEGGALFGREWFQRLKHVFGSEAEGPIEAFFDVLVSKWTGAASLKTLLYEYPRELDELIEKAEEIRRASEGLDQRRRLLEDELRHQRGNTLPESWQEPMKRYIEEFHPHLSGGAGPIPIGDIDIDVDVDVAPPDFPTLLARLEAAARTFAENVRV